LSYKNLIPKILEGEADEIVAYFPSAKTRVEEFEKRYEAYLDRVIERVRHWKSKGLTKRDLAALMLGRPAKRWDTKTGGPVAAVKPAESDAFIAGKVLEYYDVPDEQMRAKLDEELRAMGTGKNKEGKAVNFNPTRLMELLSLEDQEEGRRDEEL
jgi:hypothetical protein